MNNANFVIAVVLSLGILVGFHYFYEVPQLERVRAAAVLEEQRLSNPQVVKGIASLPRALQERQKALAPAQERVFVENGEVRGSIQLKGARLNDLELLNYRETVAQGSPNIVLLSPADSAPPHAGYFAFSGWLGEQGVVVPDETTVWKADKKTLTPRTPVLLSWDNGQGLVFERMIELDDAFLFTITERVRNAGDKTVTLYPFGAIARYGKTETQDTYVLHEGPLGVLSGTLKEPKYKDVAESGKVDFESEGGWLGFTDKYWLVALLPSQNEKIMATFSHEREGAGTSAGDVFQADFRSTPLSLAPGAVGERRSHLFAGAKRVALLDDYGDKLGLPLFDRAIDFGWYYYLTKPFLYLLHDMSLFFGHMAWAIVVFTIALKILTLPLSLKSSRAMARLKELQPEIKALQERHANDMQQANLAVMELYKREKVSPVSGCVPMLIQIPIFFALYKVLYVGMEMRHAPLFGWVRDMSMPDPTSVLTLFGVLDWPFIPHLGVWPILMGLSMFLQQKLSPQPTDKSQERIFLLMPVIFTFMLSQVSAGLIFYWTVSNILGIGQQWFVMRHTKKRTSA